MSLIKKISRIFSFLLLLTFLASCEEGCFTADQFDSYSETVLAYPKNDGVDEVSLLRDHAQWHETGLRTSGDEFIIRLTGEWTSWNGGDNGEMVESTLKALPTCNLCARKNDDTSLNCICLQGQVQESYPGKVCENYATKGDYSSENDPTACTCTKDPSQGWDADPRFSVAYAENAKYSTLNYYEKDGSKKIADRQSRCKYNHGAGLYIGLFGPTGTTVPNRVYHLYTTRTVCNVIPDEVTGECVDEDGNDKTSYEFRSANSRIFMKDDNAGNLGTDTNTSDDIYHTPNEVVKFKIYDEEYSNNFGQYNIQILRGVGDSSDRSQVGLLEFMVRLVEDAVLGDINNNDERVGGIIEFMYKAIVQDSGFMGFLRMSLILYVMIYGMAILAGVAEISKKELMSRILKIGLVLLFTSSNSWQLYNDIVVGFFLDGMDSVISMISSLSMQALDIGSSTAILDAQLDRSSNVSSSTRFTYIDNTIIMLMSESVAAKIFGLILASPFGILYVPIIYALIGIFIAVMAFAATVYLINVLKIVFALSLGPLFIVFTLFGQTSQMFKNWISFLAGRSMEMVIMFLVLFNFVVILNIAFMEMLSYETCVEMLKLPHPDFTIFTLPYLKSYVNRSIMEWMVMFMKILGLNFMTYLVLEKVGEIAGQLISISGAGNQDSAGKGRGGSGFALASKFVSGAAGVAGAAAGKVALASGYAGLAAGKGAGVAARKSGISGAISSAASSAGRATGLSQISKAISQRSPLGLKSPRAFIRDRKYKGILARAKKDIARDPSKKNATGAERNAAIQKRAMDILINSKLNDKLANQKVGKGEMHTYNLLGMGPESFLKVLNKEMVEKPLMAAMADKAKQLQSSDNPGGAKFGKEMKNELHKFANEFADKNIAGGAAGIKGIMENKDNFNRSKFEFQLHKKIEDSTKLSANKAAKAFYNDEKGQKAYMSHLQDRKNEAQAKTAKLNEDRNKRLAPVRMGLKAAGAAARAAKSISTEKNRPDLAKRNFARNIENQKAQKEGGIARYIGNKLNLTNRNDRTAAAAAMINRKVAKPTSEFMKKSGKKAMESMKKSEKGKKVLEKAAKASAAASRVAQKTKDTASHAASTPTRTVKGIMGYKPKIKEPKAEKPPKEEFKRTDRKSALANQERQSREVLREKLSSSSQDNASRAFKSDIFSGKNVDTTFKKDDSGKYVDDGGRLHKSGATDFESKNKQPRQVEDKFKGTSDLNKEKEAFESNRFDRESMQRQLGKESAGALKSKLGSSKDIDKLTSLVSKEGGFDKLIAGDKDNVKADSAYEQAARLQAINEKYNLGDKDYQKDLMEKFNEKLNSDFEDTKKAIDQDIKEGDSKSYEKHMKDIEEIEKAKSSAFSDFSNKEAGDTRYKEFFENQIKESIDNIQGRLNNDHGTSFADGHKVTKPGNDKVESENEPKKEEPREKLHSIDSKDKKANDGDLSVERMTYYNDREATDKLESFRKEESKNKAALKEVEQKNKSQEAKDKEEQKQHEEGIDKGIKSPDIEEVEIIEDKEKTAEELEKEREELRILEEEKDEKDKKEKEEKEQEEADKEEKDRQDKEDEEAERKKDNRHIDSGKLELEAEKSLLQVKLTELDSRLSIAQSKLDELIRNNPEDPEIKVLQLEMESINSEKSVVEGDISKKSSEKNTNTLDDENLT